MKCLIIAAHPDDEILGCGGTICKLAKNGIESFVLILTDGAGGRYKISMKEALKKCAINANKIAGTKKVFFENFPNQRLDTVALSKIIKVIEKYIKALKVENIFTHHAGDLNKDHRIVYEATITAARPFVGQIVKRTYAYNVPSSTEWNCLESDDVFIPNVFIDIKGEIETKIKAVRCYTSECRPYPFPRSPKAVRAHSNYWGLSAGMKYAEPFKLIRDISGDL